MIMDIRRVDGPANQPPCLCFSGGHRKAYVPSCNSECWLPGHSIVPKEPMDEICVIVTQHLDYILFLIHDVIKHYLARKLLTRIRNTFKIFIKFHFLEKHSITIENGQQFFAHKMIALPLNIQDHYFKFLVLVVDILDKYDLIVGLEAAIELEAVYHMTSHVSMFTQGQYL